MSETAKPQTIKDIVAGLKESHKEAIQSIEAFEFQNRDSHAAAKKLLDELKGTHLTAIEKISAFESQNRDSSGALLDLLKQLKAVERSGVESVESVNLDSAIGLSRPDRDVGH